MSKKQTITEEYQSAIAETSAIDAEAFQNLIIDRRLTKVYEHFADKIAICRNRIDTWKFVRSQISKLIQELTGHRVDSVEHIRISDDCILNVNYTTGYDRENGTTHLFTCDAAYLFLSTEEAKKDWNDLWDSIKKAQDEHEQEKERLERYQKFLELKQEFEPTNSIGNPPCK